MAMRHVLVSDEESLGFRRLAIFGGDVLTDRDDQSELISLGFHAPIREVIETAPVQLISRIGMLHVREDERAWLETTLLESAAGSAHRAFGLSVALRVGRDHVWSAVAVGSAETDELGGLLREEAAALAELLRDAMVAAQGSQSADDT